MISLRDYQETAVNTLVPRLVRGGRHVLCMPTGAGKSATARAIVEKVGASYAITHRKELKEQIGIKGSTVQSLLRRGPSKVLKGAEVVVWDECHHSTASEWRSVFGMLDDTPVLGLTATPVAGMADTWDTLVAPIDAPSLVRAGYLTPIRLVRPSRFIGPDLAQPPVDAYLSYTDGQQGFVYTANVKEAKEVSASFNKAGVPAAAVHGGLPKEQRDRILELFKGGRLKILCNVYVLTEGVDVPAASVAILSRGMQSVVQYLQSVGRVLRPAEGKTLATILDLSGSSWLHGSPIEARSYSLSGGTLRHASDTVRMCPQCASWRGPGAVLCDVCGWDYVANGASSRQTRYLSETMYETIHKGENYTAVWAELKRVFPHSLLKAAVEYKKACGSNPTWSPEEKEAVRRQQKLVAQAKGYSNGWVWARLKAYGAA